MRLKWPNEACPPATALPDLTTSTVLGTSVALVVVSEALWCVVGGGLPIRLNLTAGLGLPL